MDYIRLISMTLFVLASVSHAFLDEHDFLDEHEERRFLQKRHHEMREHILRSVAEDQTVHITVTINGTCAQSVPHFYNRSFGIPLQVDVDTYEYMYLNHAELCISVIEPDNIVKPANFVSGVNDVTQAGVDLVTSEYESWGVQAILKGNFPPNNNWRGNGRPPVGLCIVDSGAQIDHTDFPYRGLTNPRVDGMEFDVGDAKWNVSQSLSWHGTFVTGLICAQRGNGLGVRGIIGDCANKVQLHIARVFGSGMVATTRMSNVDKAVEWCLSKGARVINLSLATSEYNFNSHTIHKQIYADNNALVVAAAGNNGPDAPPAYPANFKEVLSVGAVDRYMNVAPFSQKNSNVMAPGVDMISTSVNFGVESNNKAYKVSPMMFSATPSRPKYGPSCDCGCGLQTCACAQENSICIIDRCPETGVSVTTQSKNAEAGDCIGAIFITSSPETLYTNSPDLDYQSTIPVVYADSTEAEDIKDSVLQTVGGIVKIDFSFPNYKIADGSSFACPLVAGLAALLMYERPKCTALQIRNAITNSAIPVDGDADLVGSGFVQGLAAYRLLLKQPSPCGFGESTSSTNSSQQGGGTTTTSPTIPRTFNSTSFFNMYPELYNKITSSRSGSSSSTYRRKSSVSGRNRGTGYNLRQR